MIKGLLFWAPSQPFFTSVSLLILRLFFGGVMLFAHGWPKLAAINERISTFPDPLGVGSPLSYSLAVFAEVGCAILVMVGLMTRFALVPLIITMAVAFFVVHGADPFAKKELAFMYLAAYVAMLLPGPGLFSLDARIARG